jgi:hypothetical protein
MNLAVTVGIFNREEIQVAIKFINGCVWRKIR